MHVGQAGARQTRLQLGEPLVRYIVGIKPAGILHQRAEQQGLAAGTRTKIDNQFATLRLQQVTEQLAAFVLHFKRPFEKQRVFGQGWLVAQADCSRRQGAGQRGNFIYSETLKHGFARRLQRIDAQIERRRLIEGLRQFQHMLRAKLFGQPGIEPIGQIAAYGGRKIGFRQGFGCGQPFLFAGAQNRRQLPLAPTTRDGQRHQQTGAIRKLAGTACLQATPAPQYGKHRFGNEGTVGMAEFTMFAEITRHNGIGRMIEFQQFAEHCFGMGKQGGGKASFHLIPNSVATCSKLSPFLSVKRILTGKRP